MAAIHLHLRQAEAEAPQAGGFVAEGDAVVQPFHLPRFEHGTYQPLASGLPAPGTSVEENGVVGKIPNFGLGGLTAPATSSRLLEYDEAEMSLPDVAPVDDAVWDARPARLSGVPRTMLELAEEEAAGMANGDPKEETAGESGGEGEGRCQGFALDPETEWVTPIRGNIKAKDQCSNDQRARRESQREGEGPGKGEGTSALRAGR